MGGGGPSDAGHEVTKIRPEFATYTQSLSSKTISYFRSKFVQYKRNSHEVLIWSSLDLPFPCRSMGSKWFCGRPPASAAAVALLYIDNSALIARLDAADDDLRSKERASEILTLPSKVGNHQNHVLLEMGCNFSSKQRLLKLIHGMASVFF